MKKFSQPMQKVFLLAFLMGASVISVSASTISNDDDTDSKLVEAKVVEVTDTRISVIARTGVEHVIALDGAETKVQLAGKVVSAKDVRVGDIINIELDENNPVKFAKNIFIALPSDSEVARARP